MKNIKNIYLDYAATTPVDERVVAAMLPYFTENFGNPSSIHFFGQKAEAAMEDARREIASLLGAHPEEIIFTGCGTESDNLAIRGAALAQQKMRGANHILTTPVEHHAISHTTAQLQREFGFNLEILPVDGTGMVSPEEISRRIRKETALVSVIYGNNEIGTVNPIPEIAAVCREKGIPFHSDAVQAAAHLDIQPAQEGVDLLAIGAHKFYGPKGIGALYARQGCPLLPTQTGGGQESGRRAGTQNVPYMVGMATALRFAHSEGETRAKHSMMLRDRIINSVLSTIPNSRLTGHPTRRLPNHASFVFRDVDGNWLLTLLDSHGFACSSGSACRSGSPEPSDVLTAMGFSADWALGSLRVTTGKDTTIADVDAFLAILPELVAKARRK